MNLPADGYQVTGFGPADGPEYGSKKAGPVAVSGLGTFSQDVTLGPSPGAPPAGTEITHISESETGLPTLYWNEGLTLTTPGVRTPRWGRDPGRRNGRPQRLDGDWPTAAGNTQVAWIRSTRTTETECLDQIRLPRRDPDETIKFSIYIDPSGVVKDAGNGEPIAGATVTLMRSGDASSRSPRDPTAARSCRPPTGANPA